MFWFIFILFSIVTANQEYLPSLIRVYDNKCHTIPMPIELCYFLEDNYIYVYANYTYLLYSDSSCDFLINENQFNCTNTCENIKNGYYQYKNNCNQNYNIGLIVFALVASMMILITIICAIYSICMSFKINRYRNRNINGEEQTIINVGKAGGIV